MINTGSFPKGLQGSKGKPSKPAAPKQEMKKIMNKTGRKK